MTEAALLQRVNRRLRHEGEVLRRCREDSRDWWELGRYYLVDVRANCILAKNLDLPMLAAELGATP